MAPAFEDPYYSRKRIPDDFIEHVGITGLTPQEEHLARERKYSIGGSDVRNFSNPKTKDGKHDPYYQRKRVSDAEIHGVGATGLSPEEEYMNRERKYSLNGADVRKFSNGTKAGMFPKDDPYYRRQSVHNSQLTGVPQSGMSRAEEYEVRERKQSVFQDSADPFQQLTGSGHRQSISGAAAPAAAAARRRSSAVAPDAMAATENHQGLHSGYDGSNLAPIESRVDYGTTSGLSDGSTAAGSHTGVSRTGITTGPTGSTGANDTGHAMFYDAATDTDNVAPDERR